MCSDSKTWFLSMSHSGEHGLWKVALNTGIAGFLYPTSNSYWGVKWPWQLFCMIMSFILHSFLFGHFFLMSPDLIKQFPGCFCVILHFSNPISLQVMLILLLMITRLHLLSNSIAFTLVQSTIISHLDSCYIVVICLPAFTIAVLSILHLTARVLLKIIITVWGI